MGELARDPTAAAPALTSPWEVPAPLLAMLAQAVRAAGPHTKTVGLQLIDRGRRGHISVDVAEARRWLSGESETVSVEVDRGRGVERRRT